MSSNGRYEYVQLDTLISLSHRTASTVGYCDTPWSELKAQMRLLAPSIAITLIQYSSTVITDSIAGHLGQFDLASLAIAYTFMRLAYGILAGMGNALETLGGQAFGAREYDMLGIYAQRSIVILLGAASLLSIPCFFSEPLLKVLGQSAGIAKEASFLLKWMLPQLFASALNFPLQRFLYAQSLIIPLLCISVSLILPQMLLSWVAAFRLNLGLVGIIIVQNVSCWLFTAFQFLYITHSDSCKSSWTGLSVCAFYQLPSFLQLSFFSSVMILLQMWYYQILMLLAGTLSDPEIEIDALTICINLICMEVMVPYAFNITTSIRVSNELGAGNSHAASFSAFVAMLGSSVVSVLLAVILLLLRNNLGYLFTDSSSVAKKVSELAPFLAATIILNGLQLVLSGVATGTGWQSYVAYANILSCYSVGLPLGLVICFAFHMGITGIWSGMIAGLTLEILIVLYMTWNANWSQQANQAIGFLRTLRESNTCNINI
ncbi:unnamed protein product [Victoria cruziana]